MPEDHLVIIVGHFIECCPWEWDADKERVEIIPAIESFLGPFSPLVVSIVYPFLIKVIRQLVGRFIPQWTSNGNNQRQAATPCRINNSQYGTISIIY